MNIYGSAIADVLDGTKSSDVIRGWGGDDMLFGHGGNDIIWGDEGNDTVLGGDGNDKITGGDGADRLDGGNGIDTVRYKDSTKGVIVSLEDGVGRMGDADGDTLINFENVDGSDYVDQLTGTEGENNIKGHAGNDLDLWDLMVATLSMAEVITTHFTVAKMPTN